MKKKARKTYWRTKSEFRYIKILVSKPDGTEKKIRHPSYIWRRRGNIYDHYPITHSSVVDGIAFIKFDVNPDPLDKEDSYHSPVTHSDYVSKFGRRIKRMSISDSDYKKLHKKRWFCK